jgi:N-[(2S)-2-amino-2-carboxyethyl]-L-glutamate dehydrogenase
MTGELVLPRTGRPRIFSPFGLGVLDLAVGSLVHRAAVGSATDRPVDDFFAETTRWT